MPKNWAPDDREQLHDEANKQLDQNLLPDERVRVIIRGVSSSAMIGTDRRVFVFKKGYLSGAAFGSKLASFDYGNLSGVHVEADMLTGYVALQGPGLGSNDLSSWGSGKADPRTIPHAIVINEKDQARQGTALLRQLVSEAQRRPQDHGAAPVAVDIPDQLRKLGELRDAGILTEEEFGAKKAELLSRL